jgi:hypothetical protein
MNVTRRAVRLLALALLVPAGGCDLTVVNAGPVQDDFLNEPGAHAAVVAGIELNLALGMNMLNFFGSDVSKEYTQGGRIHPIKLPPLPRQLDHIATELPNNAWNTAHTARWVAEDGVRRLRESMEGGFASSPLAAQALLYAGYANRALGENMCEAVVDGGAPQDRSIHLQTAEQYFTEAVEVGSAAGRADLATAAQAGRASVRLFLGDDAGAVADAGAVPVDFVYEMLYATNPTEHNNWINYISSNTPYRAHSVWDTYYEDYYQDTGDPRTAWGTDPDQLTAEFENVPWYFQLKYPDLDSPLRLSSGREMVLIQAEVELRAGDVPAAMILINSLRAGLVSDHDGTPVADWAAANETEAWTALKRERGIELWLEARRLGDLWRWVDDGTPGDMEDVTDLIRLCFPIAPSEIQTNENIALDHESPMNPLYTGS